MIINCIVALRSLVLWSLGITLGCNLPAQNILPFLEWERLYPDVACDFFKVTEASDQGYILSGTIFNKGLSDDTSLIKIDGGGSVQWARAYGGTGRELGPYLQKTSDGGYIFATASNSSPSGSKDSPNFGLNDVWIVKVDSQGQKQWERSIGGAGQDTPISILQSNDGGYMLILSVGGVDYGLFKLSAQGETEWERRMGEESSGFPQTVIRTEDGGFVLAGLSWETSETDGWVMKLNAQGNKQWEKFIGGTGEDIFFSGAITTDGGVILGGSSDSPPSGSKEAPHYGSSDHWLVKVDTEGNKNWDRSYSIPPINFNEQVNFVLQTSDQGFVFGAYSHVIKTDSNGNVQWNKVFKPDLHPSATSRVVVKDLQQTKDGGYILVGNLVRGDGTGLECDNIGWVAKLERVATHSGEVVIWKGAPGVVLESVDALDREWSSNKMEVLSVGEASAIPLVPAGQQRFYRLRAAGGSSELPKLLVGTLLSWPVDQNQILEFSANKDGNWLEYPGDQGRVGVTNYAIVPHNLRQHYFRIRKK